MKYLKLYLQTLLLLETLDEIEEQGGFKQRLKQRAKQLKQEIENFDRNIFKHTEDFDTVAVLSGRIDELLKDSIK